MAKRNAIVGTTIEGGVVRIDVQGHPTISVDCETLHQDVQLAALTREVRRRLEDAAAIERDRETGQPATPKEKYEAIRRLADWLVGAETWEMPRVGGKGGRKFNVGEVVMGMVRGLNITLDEANSNIEALSEKRGIDREAAAKVWAATPEVSMAIAQARAESAPSGADDLLAELTGE